MYACTYVWRGEPDGFDGCACSDGKRYYCFGQSNGGIYLLIVVGASERPSVLIWGKEHYSILKKCFLASLSIDSCKVLSREELRMFGV